MSWNIEPQVGDTVQTKPLRISKRGVIHGSNPTGWGEVRIREKNLDVSISEEERRAVHNYRAPFKFNSPVETHPAKIVEKNSGQIHVKFLSEDRQVTEDNKKADEPKSKRKKRIHWDGTPQEIDSEAVKRRRGTLGENDVRGSKNDLLGGHL